MTTTKSDSATNTVQTVSPNALSERLRRGESIELIDVRTPAEFRECHADAARNIPLGDFNAAAFAAGRNGGSGQPVALICKSGQRARKAADALVAAGGVNVLCVEGGTQAWVDAGLPVVRGKKAMSLERQVRIAAGMLVLIGVALAALVHPWFMAISAFVGAGLVFAGITDTCGMAMLLSRMPWNRAHGPATTCSA